MTRMCGVTPIKCRSEPARESGVSGDGDVECVGAFASRLAPTEIRVRVENCAVTQHPVGASLLAKALCQALEMLDVPDHSRAGSLPQTSAYSVIFSKLR